MRTKKPAQRNWLPVCCLRATSLVIGICLLTLSGCAGSHGSIRFDSLQYPVSMSAFLYGPENEILGKGRGLTPVKRFFYQKNYWGILYSSVSLSGTGDIAEEMNRKITEAGGDGMVSVRITAKDGFMNSIPFLNWLPFWPGYTKIEVEGVIVRQDRQQQVRQSTNNAAGEMKDDQIQTAAKTGIEVHYSGRENASH